MTKVMKDALKIRNSGCAKIDIETTARVGTEWWKVKSRSSAGVYWAVQLAPATCDCPAWTKQALPRRACAHIEAARLQKAHLTQTSPEPADPRKSYPNAPWYDRVAKIEYRAVRELLRCLGAQFAYDRPPGRGRPPVCYGDLLVVGGLARYNDDSSRYAIPEPDMLTRLQLLQRPAAPTTSTLRDHMRTDEMNAMLRRAFVLTADVVRDVETEFVMDSTQIHTPNSELFFEKAGVDGRVRYKSKNLKLNIVAGLRTHVMVGVEVMYETDSDQTAFVSTLSQFWDRFRIDTVFADAGYCTTQHYEAVAARGGVAMIDFRDPEKRKPQGMPHHDAQLAWFKADRTAWLEKYHQRSLAETVNSSFFRTVGDKLRNRFAECLVNEALMLCLVYNLVRIVHARYEFGVAIPWADERAIRVVDGLDAEPRIA